MGSQFYQQPGLNVDTYPLRTGLSPVVAGDVEFYQSLAESAPGPVLELGSGTGRILLPLARAGVRAAGLELSPAMLQNAAARLAHEPEEVRERVTLMEGNMASFAIEERFGLVIIAFRSFQLLLRPEDQRRCLECAWEHLVPGGTIAIDIFDPHLEQLLPEVDSVEATYQGNAPHPVSNNLVRLEVVSRKNDVVGQTFEEVWHFTEMARDGSVVREQTELLTMAWIYRREMRYLLELCGFKVEAEYSDYAKSPPAYGKEQIWVARKPAN